MPKTLTGRGSAVQQKFPRQQGFDMPTPLLVFPTIFFTRVKLGRLGAVETPSLSATSAVQISNLGTKRGSVVGPDSTRHQA